MVNMAATEFKSELFSSMFGFPMHRRIVHSSRILKHVPLHTADRGQCETDPVV